MFFLFFGILIHTVYEILYELYCTSKSASTQERRAMIMSPHTVVLCCRGLSTCNSNPVIRCSERGAERCGPSYESLCSKCSINPFRASSSQENLSLNWLTCNPVSARRSM